MRERRRSVPRPPRSSLAATLALALALGVAGCGRYGQDTAAVMAAHAVVERELGVQRVEFNGTRILEKAPPWYLLGTEVEIETAEGRRDHGALLVVLALNPDNGIEYRYHPGLALARVHDLVNPSPERLRDLKSRNGWGARVDW